MGKKSPHDVTGRGEMRRNAAVVVVFTFSLSNPALLIDTPEHGVFHAARSFCSSILLGAHVLELALLCYFALFSNRISIVSHVIS